MRGSLHSLCFWLCSATALSVAAEDPSNEPMTPINIATPTLGGKQFWADELLFHKWRVQRNILTGHFRLLDENNVRRAWGSFDDCRNALDEIKRRDNLPPMKGKLILVLHGLGRTRSPMSGMATFLEQKENCEAVAISYPSTMADVEQHAASLSHLMENLGDVDEVDFVAHSLGNLVIRRYLYDQQHSNQKPRHPPIKRIVMLGAPNNGSQLAAGISRYPPAAQLIGVPGRELGTGWDQLKEHLALPQCEFGIIAGGKGDDKGYNPMLSGDNDMIVTVDETRLPGAADFIRLPVVHTFMMDNPDVQQATLSFLEHGYFVAPDKRQPVDRIESR